MKLIAIPSLLAPLLTSACASSEIPVNENVTPSVAEAEAGPAPRTTGFAQTASASLEEPVFEVIDIRDGFEIRRYKPFIVAETTVTGTTREAGNKGFRILASYIFGDNTASSRMEMTAPVTTRAAGEKMKMTAPVTMRMGAKDSFTMRFVMERKYTMKTLPRPTDARVSIVEIPQRTVAVLRYSGRTTDALFEAKREVLLERLSEAGIKPVAQPVKAVFNGPWTPGFMRRNEVQVEVEWKPARGVVIR